jgi:hypothetical protein
MSAALRTGPGDGNEEIGIGRGIVGQAAVFQFVDHTNDRHPRRLGFQAAGLDAFADRVRNGPEAFGKAFADDDHRGGIVHFGIAKGAAGEERDSQGAEEIGTHTVRVGPRPVLRGDGGLAFRGVEGGAAAIERDVAAQTDG